MNLTNILSSIDKLKQELDELRPWSPTVQRKIDNKFRLEWNYHSNAIEGNTLTFGETKMLLLHGFHTGNKLGRHYTEVKLHDEVLNILQDVVRRKEPLSEKLIRELHSRLMGQEYYVNAQDDHNNTVSVKGNPGQYKTKANGVRRVINGKETFVVFKSPDDVRIEMPELLTWYRDHDSKNDIHPVELAATFHYKFVKLHPFDDGNGRMSRLLMNMILLSKGYLPAIIRLEERDQYIATLVRGDDDELEPFIELVAKDELRSLSLLRKALAGESIEEPGDLEKEVKLLKEQLKDNEDLLFAKNTKALLALYEASFRPLFESLHEKLVQFDEFFVGRKSEAVFVNQGYGASQGDNYLGHADRIFLFETSEILPSDLDQVLGNPHWADQMTSLEYRVRWEGFKKNKKNPFDIDIRLIINLERMRYTVVCDGEQVENEREMYQKAYHELLSEEEVNSILQSSGRLVLERIKDKLGLHELPF